MPARLNCSTVQIEFYTLSVHLYSYVTSVNLVFVSNKIINNSDNFRIKENECSFVCSLFSVFTLFYLII